jgi:RND family efflux transporter MFP subunit
MEAAKAAVNSSKANVDRLVSLQGFEKVVAPFSGKVTARFFDVGALLSPTSAMFRVTQDDTMRVFCSVPQPYINSLKIGGAAKMTVRNYPGKEFVGTITRTADAIDAPTRTMKYEIDFPNKDGQLVANMYGQVILTVKAEKPPIMVPTSAVVFDSQGTKIWYVKDSKAYAKKVDLGHDYGTDVEVPTGLTGDETVIVNPGERLADGAEVQAIAQNAPPGGGASGGTAAAPGGDNGSKGQQAAAK